MKKHAFILTTVLMTLCVCLPVSAKNKKDVLNRDNQQIEVVVEQNVELETEQKEAPKAEIKENFLEPFNTTPLSVVEYFRRFIITPFKSC